MIGTVGRRSVFVVVVSVGKVSQETELRSLILEKDEQRQNSTC